MSRAIRHAHAERRRGSVYILVLAAAAMLTVVGIGVATLTRTQIAADGLDRDAERAVGMAHSAAHAGIAWINSTPDWRTQVYSAQRGGEIPPYGRFRLTMEAGGAACQWWIDDGAGGVISPDPADPVRVIGLGRSGRAQRVLTAVLDSNPAPMTAVYSCAVHTDYKLTLNNSTVLDGLASCNQEITVTGSVTASIEAPSIVLSGALSGVATSPVPAKPMPEASGPDSPLEIIGATARDISLASIPGRTINLALLSPASNPYGSTQAEGIYRIEVPAGQTLEIRNSRICATLIVLLRGNARLRVTQSVSWSPAVADLPALIVHGTTGTLELAFSGSSSLVESSLGVNFNPAGSPFRGDTDNNQNDRYPSQIAGLIHVAGGAATAVHNDVRVQGCILSDGAIDVAAAFIRADPALGSSPLRGYTLPGYRMQLSAGSWRQLPYSLVAAGDPEAAAAAEAPAEDAKGDDGGKTAAADGGGK